MTFATVNINVASYFYKDFSKALNKVKDFLYKKRIFSIILILKQYFYGREAVFYEYPKRSYFN